MHTCSESPLVSLQRGQWFKLICGASYQHLPTIRQFVLAYGLAGADCIDVAADPAVVHSVNQALITLEQFRPEAQSLGFPAVARPWLMVSLNDDDDPHFRKAIFEAATCPVECLRPCETICPAHAIAFSELSTHLPLHGGVIADRCYGCGRCIPVCPQNKIATVAHRSSPDAIIPLITSGQVQAIEIHTQVGHQGAFAHLWQTLRPSIASLRVLAISCTDAESLVEYLQELYRIIAPLPCPLIWQIDGRSMSGDIGKGTTHAAIHAGQKVLAAELPGFIQLAGGTNDYTVPKLTALGLLNPHRASCDRTSSHVAGVAYGSYARKRLQPFFESLETDSPSLRLRQLEDNPDLLWSAVAAAYQLIHPLKPNGAVVP